MKKSDDEPETHEVVDIDYIGIASFLVFLVVLWQNAYFVNNC